MTPTEAIGPLALFLLMTIVGLELTVADFRRVLSAPRPIVAGTLGQLALLPLMTWGVVTLLEVPPVFGAGAVLVAVAPGAGISNVLTMLAGANTALSVTLTATTSVLSVATLPTLAALGMRFFLGGDADVQVPVGLLTGQLLVALPLPIALGMWVRRRWPEFAMKHAARLQRGALVAITALILLGIAFGDVGELSFEDAEAGLLAAGVWTAAAMAIGYGIATALRRPSADRFTFLIEFSARNIAVAAMVAISGLGRLDLTFFSGAYMAVGYPLCAAAVLVRRRTRVG